MPTSERFALRQSYLEGHQNTEDAKQFEKLYRKRVANNQDLAVLVSDHQNRRGTGKTVLSLKLASKMDRTDDGLTKEKVAIDPDELTEAYIELPKGSALVLDEAEAGLSKYEAASAVNRAMRELVSMGRIREKYLVLNLPASSELDRDLKALCDFWFMITQKGRASGHHLRWNPYSEEPRTPKTSTWEWEDIAEDSALKDVYDYLTDEKMAHLRGERDGSSQRIPASDVKKMIEQAKDEAATETRNDLLRDFYDQFDLTQNDLGDAVGLSRSRVADILSE
jgi:antitoxin component HigA of HigAB toxin-antitoxin module